MILSKRMEKTFRETGMKNREKLLDEISEVALSNLVTYSG